MKREPLTVGQIVLYVIAIGALIGGIALFVAAARWMPTEPHHGEAIDGLDGLGTMFALAAGFGGIVAVLIGWLVLRAARRAGRDAPPAPPRATVVSTTADEARAAESRRRA